MYFILSSFWVKNILNGKKFNSFLQSKLLYNYTLNCSYSNIFTRKSNLIQLIGSGLLAINCFPSNKHSYINLISPTKLKKTILLVPTANFNKLSTIHKLKNLGFSITNLNFLETSLPPKHLNYSLINAVPSKYPLYCNYSLFLHIIITKLVSLRSIHTYLLLLLILK